MTAINLFISYIVATISMMVIYGLTSDDDKDKKLAPFDKWLLWVVTAILMYAGATIIGTGLSNNHTVMTWFIVCICATFILSSGIIIFRKVTKDTFKKRLFGFLKSSTFTIVMGVLMYLIITFVKK